MVNRSTQANRKGAADKDAGAGDDPGGDGGAATPRLREWPAAAIVFFVSFCVYVRCLHPGAAAADSSELVAAAHAGGAAHPPGEPPLPDGNHSSHSQAGYPLFCITYKIASLLIPIFGIAWRMNLFNALVTAAAAAVVACTSARLSSSLPAAVLSGFLYALCETGWHFALHAEVFALNSLATAVAMFILLRFFEAPTQSLCVLGAHAFCIGLANQHTLVLLLPPVAAAVLARKASICFARSTIFHLLFAALLGASFYLYHYPPSRHLALSPCRSERFSFALFNDAVCRYLPFATSHSPHVSWGNSNTFAGFKKSVLKHSFSPAAAACTESLDCVLQACAARGVRHVQAHC